MATTLGALSYKVIADTSQFKRGMESAKDQLQDLNRHMKKGTPARIASSGFERVASGLSKIGRAGKGAITALGNAHKVLLSMDVIVRGIGAGLNAMSAAFGRVNQLFSDVNQTIRFQERLSLTNEEMGTLVVMADKSGFALEKVVDGMAELNKRMTEADFEANNELAVIEKAAADRRKLLDELNALQSSAPDNPLLADVERIVNADTVKTITADIRRLDKVISGEIRGGEAFEAFTKGMGLTIEELGKLSKLNAIDQLQKMQEIMTTKTPQQQLFFTDEIAQSEEFENLFRLNLEHMEEFKRQANQVGLVLREDQTAGIKNTASAFKDVTIAIKGMMTQFAAVSADQIGHVAEAIGDMATSFAEMIKNDPKAIVNTLRDMVEVMKDVIEVLKDQVPKFAIQARAGISNERIDLRTGRGGGMLRAGVAKEQAKNLEANQKTAHILGKIAAKLATAPETVELTRVEGL